MTVALVTFISQSNKWGGTLIDEDSEQAHFDSDILLFCFGASCSKSYRKTLGEGIHLHGDATIQTQNRVGQPS